MIPVVSWMDLVPAGVRIATRLLDEAGYMFGRRSQLTTPDSRAAETG